MKKWDLSSWERWVSWCVVLDDGLRCVACCENQECVCKNGNVYAGVQGYKNVIIIHDPLALSTYGEIKSPKKSSDLVLQW